MQLMKEKDLNVTYVHLLYSKVPNKRTEPNKSTGEKFCQNK